MWRCWMPIPVLLVLSRLCWRDQPAGGLSGRAGAATFFKLNACARSSSIFWSVCVINVIREEVEAPAGNITTLAEAAALASSSALTDELVSHWRTDVHPAVCGDSA